VSQVLKAFEKDPRLKKIKRVEFIGKDIVEVAATVGAVTSKCKHSFYRLSII
jgi:hypothetical protein